MYIPGTKIRDTKFGDTPVTIYISNDGEYLLEYEKDGEKLIHNCGRCSMFWEALSDIFGGGAVPDGFEMIDIINQVEESVKSPLKENELAALIREILDKHPLMPSYIPEEIMDAAKQRLILTNAGYAVMTDLTLDGFLAHAIRSKMIFRMSDACYSQKTVRINKVLRRGNDIYLYVAFIEAEENPDDTLYWCEDSYGVVKYDDVRLEHNKLDELPADYQE